MDLEMERLINPYPSAHMPILVVSDDDICAFQASASILENINPITTEIMNQPTARNYPYMKLKQRY